MQVRYPHFDLADASPFWGDDSDACVLVNAGGIIPSTIERYLIRVVQRAKKLLDPLVDAALIADIEVFNKQEGQHLKLHAQYVAMLRDNGYPRIVEFEAAFASDLEQYLATKPLDWNLAYCEGFESSGTAMAEGWINGDIKELCGDHGSEPMRLWMWHLAEEFEHRTVVHDILERIYGPQKAFELRKSGADSNRGHTRGYVLQAAAYMYEVNRASMTPREVEASKERELAAMMGMAGLSLERLNWVYEADYDPRQVEVPRDYQLLLDMYAPT
jgi:uncharacterized protein